MVRHIEPLLDGCWNSSRRCGFRTSLVNQRVNALVSLVQDVHQGEVEARKPGALVELLPLDKRDAAIVQLKGVTGAFVLDFSSSANNLARTSYTSAAFRLSADSSPRRMVSKSLPWLRMSRRTQSAMPAPTISQKAVTITQLTSDARTVQSHRMKTIPPVTGSATTDARRPRAVRLRIFARRTRRSVSVSGRRDGLNT